MKDYTDVSIAIYGQSEIVGFYEHFAEKKHKITNLIAKTTDAELYVIDKSIFFSVVNNQLTLNKLKSLFVNQLELIKN
jgi:protein involved in sex pheromone biosynthesis